MKTLIAILFVFVSVLNSWALDIDTDSNSAVDVEYGGTNAATASDARTNLGVAIGSDVQGYDADLDTYAGITPSANVQSLLGAADYSAMRTLLSLVPGTNVQAYDADLTTFAGITPSANVQSLLGAADYAAIKALLSIDDLVTLSGVADGAANLGTFTGSTIADNQTIKVALQSLETAVEAAGGGSPGGSTTQIQYNNAGSFAGVSTLTTSDGSTLVLSGELQMTGSGSITGLTTIKLSNADTSAGYLEFYEDSDNGTNKVTLIGPASTADVTITLPAIAGTIPVIVASGTKSLATSEIASGACSAAQDGGTATGVVTTDLIDWTPNADPTGVTGYAVSATGSLYIWAYPTSDHVNFKVCNNTAGALTPGALTLNWRVMR